MKTPTFESLVNKVAGLRDCNFIKKRLQHRCFLELQRLRILALELHKSLKNSSPIYIKELFVKQNSGARRKNDLKINLANTTTYGKKTVKSLGREVCNSFPEHVKDKNALNKFQNYVNT